MEETKKLIDDAIAILSTLSVNGDAVEVMAQPRASCGKHPQISMRNPMADKNISTLPAVESIDNDSLFVAEQHGVASKVTGAAGCVNLQEVLTQCTSRL